MAFNINFSLRNSILITMKSHILYWAYTRRQFLWTKSMVYLHDKQCKQTIYSVGGIGLSPEVLLKFFDPGHMLRGRNKDIYLRKRNYLENPIRLEMWLKNFSSEVLGHEPHNFFIMDQLHSNTPPSLGISYIVGFFFQRR